MADPKQNNKYATGFDLTALLELIKLDIFNSLNCHALGTIQSFDSDAQTAQVTINYKTTINGALVDYPVLLDCPVIILTGGNCSLTFPIAAGDTCLILFNDRDIDNWFSGGQVGPLASQRLHSFSDAIALVGLRSAQNALSTYDTARASLQNGTTRVAVGASKLLLENNLYTLNTLLQELVTDIQNLVTATAAITVICATPGNPSSVPVNVAAIVAAGTSLGATATKIGDLLE